MCIAAWLLPIDINWNRQVESCGILAGNKASCCASSEWYFKKGTYKSAEYAVCEGIWRNYILKSVGLHKSTVTTKSSRKHHQSLNILPHALTYYMCSMISLVCLTQIFPTTNSSSNDLLYAMILHWDIFFTRAYVSTKSDVVPWKTDTMHFIK